VLDGVPVAMGRAAFLQELASIPEIPAHDGPVVGVARAGRFLGWLLLADEPRAEARSALEDLRSLGLSRQILLTGDRRSVAQAMAARLGISEVQAEVLPQQKLDCVLAETAAGRRPLVVGDGINDALALKAGAVGVAMGAHGTDVALASSDLVLMSSNLARLGTCIRLSRRCRRTINLNVAIGLGWTLLIIAVASMGFITPIGAAMLHNLGTLAVMANAGRLLKFNET
jgi:P-type E1-E2 ATPase